jgi:hypothetical protein
MELDFEMDKITSSIENAETGERLKTLVLPLGKADLKLVTKKSGWLFNWKTEFAQLGRNVYKLVTEKEPNVIQGLISFEKKEDHVFMHLIESALANIGRKKRYDGVCGNLVAYGCKLSEEYGFDGEMAFISKTTLIAHYEKVLGAIHIGGGRMIIRKKDAVVLINKYFSKEEK